MRKQRRARPSIPFDSFRLFAFGSREELTAAYGSMEDAERAWLSVRDEFLERWQLWDRPSAWWHFEPGVPEDLRAGPHAILTDRDGAEWQRITQGRRRHLLSLGIDPAPDLPHTPFGEA